jgi:hypothetical protein
VKEIPGRTRVRKFLAITAAAMMLSPALFAQQSTTSSTPSAQKTKLTSEQKTELKQLRAKAKTECKTDRKSEACKDARADLKSKMKEYGVKRTGHKMHMHKKAAQTPA